MEHISDQILPYLENRVSADDRQYIETHLTDCETCRAEVAALSELVSLLTEVSRAVQTAPVNTSRRWLIIRDRWQSPLVAGVRNVSRRLSWQVATSLAVVMALVSGLSLSTVQAATQSIPSIQTPGALPTLTSDTPTLTVTHALGSSRTPTLTLTPIP